MHRPINVKSPNNISKWQMGFNSAFKGLIWYVASYIMYYMGNAIPLNLQWFSFHLHSQYYKGSTLHGQLSIEYWWIETTRKRLRYSYRSLSKCNFVFHKLKSGPIGEGPATLWVRVRCYVMAVDLCLQSEVCICYKWISKSIIKKTNMSISYWIHSLFQWFYYLLICLLLLSV
jgi:hypothetical protein